MHHSGSPCWVSVAKKCRWHIFASGVRSSASIEARLRLAHKARRGSDWREAEPATRCMNKFAAKAAKKLSPSLQIEEFFLLAPRAFCEQKRKTSPSVPTSLDQTVANGWRWVETGGGKGAKTKARGDCLRPCFGSPCWARTSDTLYEQICRKGGKKIVAFAAN